MSLIRYIIVSNEVYAIRYGVEVVGEKHVFR